MRKLTSGVPIDLFDTLDSTSLEARRRVEAGALGPQWLVALAQTAGYGRRRRAWVQGPGDFAGTLYFKPDSPANILGQFSFVTALAVHDALAALDPRMPLALKWPNDILAGGAKLSGILLETIGDEHGAALLVGVGVNIVSKPTGLDYPTARLADLSRQEPPTPMDFVDILDQRFWARRDEWRDNGFAPIRDAWLARAHGLGETITVRLPNEEIVGVFDGIDDNGALLLRLGGQKRVISAGDVFFGERLA